MAVTTEKAAGFLLRVCGVGDACRGMFVRVCTRLVCLREGESFSELPLLIEADVHIGREAKHPGT